MKAALILIGIWVFVGAGVFWASRAKPTAATVTAYLSAHPLPESPSERAKIIEGVAEQMNRLEYPERNQLRQRRGLEGFYKAMTETERGRFLDLTLPQGFRQMMRAFNDMEPGRRKRFVDRALADLEKDAPPENEDRISPEERQKIINEGLSAFYEEANADVKLEFAPLIEQLQRSLQGLR